MKKTLWIASLGIAAAIASIGSVGAQIAGATSLGVAVTEMTQVTLGWSVTRSIIGKTLYSDAGEKIGEIEDLIIAPDKSVSYLIVGAGGFIGIGRHDVAIPFAQIREQEGRIVLPGATRDAVKALPPFEYASNTVRHEQFLAKAEQDIAKAKEKLAEIQKRAAAATGEAKTKLDQQMVVLQQDLKVVEDKMIALKKASAGKWKEFEADVSRAVARLRLSIDKATS
jgi:sporulation protein YlmC with PRC-barrel domain